MGSYSVERVRALVPAALFLDRCQLDLDKECVAKPKNVDPRTSTDMVTEAIDLRAAIKRVKEENETKAKWLMLVLLTRTKTTVTPYGFGPKEKEYELKLVSYLNDRTL